MGESWCWILRLPDFTSAHNIFRNFVTILVSLEDPSPVQTIYGIFIGEEGRGKFDLKTEMDSLAFSCLRKFLPRAETKGPIVSRSRRAMSETEACLGPAASHTHGSNLCHPIKTH